MYGRTAGPGDSGDDVDGRHDFDHADHVRNFDGSHIIATRLGFDVTPEVRRAVGKRSLDCLPSALSRSLRLKRDRSAAIRFVSLPEMRRLNRVYRDCDRPTDVLSFTPNASAQMKDADYLGDIVICPAYAKREAARRAIPLQEELVRLVVHGTMHLAGWDHERPADELRMFRVQERLVESCI